MDDNDSPVDGDPESTEGSPLQITAFLNPGRRPLRIVPAPYMREWINELPERFASRCLPLMMANQSGWHLLNPIAFRVSWNGVLTPDGVQIENLEQPGKPVPHIERHFGHGIVTFTLPYLFRTSPGYNLLVRGPANMPKHGIAPLEGLVETDWAVASFAVNWKFTKPDQQVVFDLEEPFGMLVPQPRGDLERFQPEVRGLESDPYFSEQYDRWATSRRYNKEFRLVVARLTGEMSIRKVKLQMDYVRGTSPGGASATHGHDTRRKLRGFTTEDSREPADRPLENGEVDPTADEV
jgi:hypothetical protein